MARARKAAKRGTRAAVGKTERSSSTWLKIQRLWRKKRLNTNQIVPKNVKTKILKVFRDGLFYYGLKKMIDYFDGG